MTFAENIKADTATALFTNEECVAIIAVCDRELTKLLGKGSASWTFSGAIREVKMLATMCQDFNAGHEGFETAHDDLQAELEEIDFHPLWVATASVKVTA